MFVINRKRIQIMLSAILVSVLVFGVQISLKEKEELTVETTSTPTSNKTIVIDASNGRWDPSKTETEGENEKIINKKK